jgi:hypothetical protein
VRRPRTAQAPSRALLGIVRSPKPQRTLIVPGDGSRQDRKATHVARLIDGVILLARHFATR